MESISYGAHPFQTLHILQNQQCTESNPIWIIYIHGGAWRDPTQSSADFFPALQLLLKEDAFSRASSRIAGFASLNYRLSPYPNGSEEKVVHPAHIDDVLQALLKLNQLHEVGGPTGPDYLVVGHSCGGTLAFQLVGGAGIRGGLELPRQSIRAPVAVVSISGLHDLPLLAKNHADQPIYAEFLTGAFGESVDAWAAGSPVNGVFDLENWPAAGRSRVAVIVWSPDDGLVEEDQKSVMIRLLQETYGFEAANASQADAEPARGRVLELEVSESHDGTWQKGNVVAQSIDAVLEVLCADS